MILFFQNSVFVICNKCIGTNKFFLGVSCVGPGARLVVKVSGGGGGGASCVEAPLFFFLGYTLNGHLV